MIRPSTIVSIASVSLAALLLAAPSASAQTTPPTPPPQTPSAPATPGTTPSPSAGTPFIDRLFALGGSGIALGDEHKGGDFGGDVGVSLASHLQIEAEFGYLTNITPNAVETQIAQSALALGDSIGGPVTVTHAAIPVRYEMAVVHATLMKIHAVTPFLEAGIGEAHVSSQLTAESSGIDMSSQVASMVTLPATSMDRMVTGGAGVTFRLAARHAIDVGYRVDRIADTTPKLDTQRVYGAYRFVF